MPGHDVLGRDEVAGSASAGPASASTRPARPRPRRSSGTRAGQPVKSLVSHRPSLVAGRRSRWARCAARWQSTHHPMVSGLTCREHVHRLDLAVAGLAASPAATCRSWVKKTWSGQAVDAVHSRTFPSSKVCDHQLHVRLVLGHELVTADAAGHRRECPPPARARRRRGTSRQPISLTPACTRWLNGTGCGRRRVPPRSAGDAGRRQDAQDQRGARDRPMTLSSLQGEVRLGASSRRPP